MQQLLIATTNPGKRAEYAEIFADLPLQLVMLKDIGIDDDVEETGATFAENAQLKAEYYCARSGLLTLADDSGIEVAALNGEPGVHSARWAGPVSATERNARLLERLKDVPFHARLARFVCIIAVAAPGQPTRFAEGTVNGVVEFAPRGTGGFGYDPLFYLLDEDKTMAELPPERKHALSHRGIAARNARAILHELTGQELR